MASVASFVPVKVLGSHQTELRSHLPVAEGRSGLLWRIARRALGPTVLTNPGLDPIPQPKRTGGVRVKGRACSIASATPEAPLRCAPAARNR